MFLLKKLAPSKAAYMNKALTYDKQPKKKTYTQQKSSLYPNKKTNFFVRYLSLFLAIHRTL